MLTEQGLKLLSDPRVTKAMQDPRVMRGVLRAMELRGKVQEGMDQTVEQLAGQLGLVTKKEVRELKRSMRKLETELKRTKKAAAAREGSHDEVPSAE